MQNLDDTKKALEVQKLQIDIKNASSKVILFIPIVASLINAAALVVIAVLVFRLVQTPQLAENEREHAAALAIDTLKISDLNDRKAMLGGLVKQYPESSLLQSLQASTQQLAVTSDVLSGLTISNDNLDVKCQQINSQISLLATEGNRLQAELGKATDLVADSIKRQIGDVEQLRTKAIKEREALKCPA